MKGSSGFQETQVFFAVVDDDSYIIDSSQAAEVLQALLTKITLKC